MIGEKERCGKGNEDRLGVGRGLSRIRKGGK